MTSLAALGDAPALKLMMVLVALASTIEARAPAPAIVTGLLTDSTPSSSTIRAAGRLIWSPPPDPAFTAAIAWRSEQVPPVQPPPGGSPCVLTV